jgi:hypothetical protein
MYTIMGRNWIWIIAPLLGLLQIAVAALTATGASVTLNGIDYFIDPYSKHTS